MGPWLRGWKEIAAYISSSVRTAKRYHYEYGMPIRRGPRNMPIALSPELDAWLIIADEKKRELRASKH